MPPSTAPLAGRGTELAVLARLADAARRDGDLRVAVVSGEAGMGKTALIEAFCATVADQATVLRGECLDLGSARLPYAPVVQALRPILRAPAEAGLRLDDPARSTLSRLVPELGRHDEPGRGPEVPAGIQDLEVGHTQLYEHLLGVVEGVARAAGLAVWCVEDIHFSEPATRDLIQFMVGNLAAVPVLLVLTVRTDEVGRRHPVRPLLAALDRSPRATSVALGPLGPVPMTELIRPALADCSQRQVDEVLDRAAGNPLFALELAAGGTHLPSQLSDLLLDRVERCDPATQQVLRVMAAAGEHVPHEVLAAVTGLASEALTTALREAVDSRLVVVTADGTYRFRHALMQEATEDALLPGEAVELHAALAEVLTADGGPGGPHAARLARHYRAAHRPELEIQAAYVAGRRALDVVAYADAQAHFERVAALWADVADAAERTGDDLAGVLKHAAICAISGYDLRRGIALANQALAHLDAEAEPERAGLIHMWVGHGSKADWTAAEAAYRLAVETVPDADTPARARVEAAFATALELEDHVEEAEARALRAIEVARRAGSPRDEAYAMITLASIRSRTGSPEADELFASARALAEDIGRIDYLLRCDINLSDHHTVHGRFAEAVAVAERGIALARTHGLERTYGSVLRSNALEALVPLGRLAEAHELAAENAVTAPDGITGAHALMTLGAVEVRLGLVEEAADSALAAERHLGRTSQPQFRSMLDRLSCEVAMATGAHDRALSLSLAALAHLSTRTGLARHDAGIAVQGAEAVRAGAGGPDELAVLGDAVAAAARRGESAPHAADRRQLAALLAEVAGAADAVDRWDAAATGFAELSMPVERSRCLLGAAELRLRDGDRAGAQRDWKRALRLATDAEARRLVHAAEALGRRGGFLAGDDVADGYGLTAREHEVLRLVAEGLSNAEIGERLFIAAKTASVHVSNILAKMGVPSRQHAAALAHRSGILS
ncbi:LuxR C-terminal-related transcriptional regulator [Euzebya sp.]|uniref:ATP-binding protein n=1 Tax=Euzebya sp. TaxID=1971409 RepID=UPI003516DF34